MPVQSDPSFKHGAPLKTLILWVNLGSPQRLNRWRIWGFLWRLLSDRRVVELPRLFWLLLLGGVILPLRLGKVKAKYREIWQHPRDLPSPLMVNSLALVEGLQAELKGRQQDVVVKLAMRYSKPDMEAVLKQEMPQRLLLLPAYPQYSATTTAAVFDQLADFMRRQRNLPELRFVKQYHDHPAYIRALARHIEHYWEEQGRGERLLLSFHGIPERNLHLGDPYFCACHKTARLLRQALGCGEEEVVLGFQSRFGRAKWLGPYSHDLLVAWGQAGLKRVDVFCPGFTADCLETLEEIAIAEGNCFVAAGGEVLTYIPALNATPGWVSAVADICETHLAGWDTLKSTVIDAENAQSRALTEKLARAAGAAQ